MYDTSTMNDDELYSSTSVFFCVRPTNSCTAACSSSMRIQ